MSLKMLGFVITLLFASCSTMADSCARVPKLPATIQQGELLTLTLCPNTEVEWLGVRTRSDAQGRVVIGVGRDITQADLAVAGQPIQHVKIKLRNYNISRVEGVPAKTVTPPQSQIDRIVAEQKKVIAAKATVVNSDAWSHPAIWPVRGRISGVYGSQRFYNGNPGSPHYGLDIAVPVGTPVQAPIAGQVVLAEDDLFYSGGTIIVAHGQGLTSSFLHLSSVDVKVGDWVNQGDVIAKVGATGRASGPHLDWRMNWYSQRVDTQLLLPNN